MAYLKRSRRVDSPSIFYFRPTPKTHWDRYSASWQNSGNFRPNPRFWQDIQWLLIGFLFTPGHFRSFLVIQKIFSTTCVFFFYWIFELGDWFGMTICSQITSFIEFEYSFFPSWNSDFVFFAIIQQPIDQCFLIRFYQM